MGRTSWQHIHALCLNSVQVAPVYVVPSPDDVTPPCTPRPCDAMVPEFVPDSSGLVTALRQLAETVEQDLSVRANLVAKNIPKEKDTNPHFTLLSIVDLRASIGKYLPIVCP